MKKILIAVLVLGVIGTVGYFKYWPEYQAGEQFEQAEAQRTAGQIAQALPAYKTLAEGRTGYSNKAKAALLAWLEQDSSISQLNAQLVVEQLLPWLGREHIAAGLAQFAERAAQSAQVDDPVAVALLSALAGADEATEQAKAEALLMPRLKSWLAKTPQQPAWAVRYAVWLADQEGDNRQQIRQLLEPNEAAILSSVQSGWGEATATRTTGANKPKTLAEGARLLGEALFAVKENQRAFALLEPYVRIGLKHKTKVAEKYQKAVDAAWDTKLAMLNNDLAPPGFYIAYDSATTDEEKQALVSKTIWSMIDQDQAIAKMQQDYLHVQRVIDPAIGLAILRINRAQTMSGNERQQELEKAEQTFLAIADEAGQSYTYRLYLGKVYYWLGKPEQGKALFEELLIANKRSHEILTDLSYTLRGLGDHDYARQLLEEAYSIAKDDKQRYGAAHARSILNTSIEDQTDWLSKADPNNPSIKATLLDVQASEHARQGDFSAAKRDYLAAVEVRADMPDGAAKFNNSSITYQSLFQMTADVQYLERSSELMAKAVEFLPSDAVLLNNAAHQLVSVGLYKLLGSQMNFAALQTSPGWSDLAFFHASDEQRRQLVSKWASYPELKTAEEYYERLLVLAPQNKGVYEALAQMYRYTDRIDAFAQLATKAVAIPLDSERELQQSRDRYANAQDPQAKQQLQSAIEQDRQKLKSSKLGGIERRYLRYQLTRKQWSLIENYDEPLAPAVLQAAEQLYREHPSLAVHDLLLGLTAVALHQQLLANNSDYVAFVNQSAMAFSANQMLRSAYRQGPTPLREAIAAHPTTAKLQSLSKAELQAFPAQIGFSVLDWLSADEAVDQAGLLQTWQQGWKQHATQMDAALYPWASSGRLSLAEWHVLKGDVDQANRLVTESSQQGLPMLKLQF